ncbi:MAG: restriction endonuclease subunit S [Dehalococcoidia bacterium]|nr:restriction endonuclease subunit S [Dehalococcoidia bacterium]
MSLRFTNVRLGDLFEVESGEFHATHELEHGEVPLISCGAVEDGLVGYFDIPPEQRHRDCITVAYNGSWPLLAKFHPYDFGAKDDVAVLAPRQQMRERTLLYVAAVLNLMTWRYSYYRKTFRTRVRNTPIPIPMKAGRVDEDGIEALAKLDAAAFTPLRHAVGGSASAPKGWKRFSIPDLFKVERGAFHSLADLDPGPYMTVSRVVTDNGVVGYFERPDDATIYPAGTITVSTLGGDAFVHMDEFIASDNVLILLPRREMPLTTRLFVALMLNQQTWRYSYGRQCYRAKFLATELWLPVTDEAGLPDDDFMRATVERDGYWPVVKARIEAR